MLKSEGSVEYQRSPSPGAKCRGIDAPDFAPVKHSLLAVSRHPFLSQSAVASKQHLPSFANGQKKTYSEAAASGRYALFLVWFSIPYVAFYSVPVLMWAM
jgi:hypothetical protein